MPSAGVAGWMEGEAAMIVTAALALPMDGRAPIPDAAVLIADGRIVAVGPRAEILARPDAAGRECLDYGAAIVLPGLVNAHIHLEYTHLGPLPAPQRFFPWLQGLVRWSAERGPEDWLASARDGAAGCRRAGVTCLGEIVTRGQGLAAMAEAGLRGVAYLEFIGGGADLAARLAQFDARTAEAAATVRAAGNPGLRLGLSPHTPYSVSAAGIRAVAGRAHRAGAPLAMHLAESAGEVALLLDGTGEIADFLRTIEPDGQPREPYRAGGHGLGPVAYVATQGLFAPGHPTLLIHAVHLGPEDIARIVAAGAAVALCPRSNTLLECGDAPVAALLDAGVPLGVGTDSLGSNRDLDLFAELRALAATVRQQRAERGEPLDEGALARRLLGLVTAEGARALALDDQVGTLTPGKLADLAILALDPAGGDPYRLILDRASAADLRATIIGGRVAYDAATPATPTPAGARG